MKCPNKHKKVIFPNVHPKGLGWDEGSSYKNDFTAMNCMKYPDLHRKSSFTTFTPWWGGWGVKLKK